MKITLIGLGKMGSVLAQRLLLAHFDLTVFNRTREKMTPIIEAGAKGATSIEDAVKDAHIIITSLLDDNAVLETVNNFIHALKPHAIHVGTSTILPETSKKLAEMHQKQGSCLPLLLLDKLMPLNNVNQHLNPTLSKLSTSELKLIKQMLLKYV